MTLDPDSLGQLDTQPAFPQGEEAGAPAGYRIEGELGRGGMGVVYRAVQEGLHRTVALKMVLAGAHAAGHVLRRFLAEAAAVAKLNHPNVVQVHDHGTHAGLPFFALEFCPGGSLADRLRAGPLPHREAAALLEQLAAAVQYAHSKGVVHRDLKPANVLFADDGTPKVADFGLAKLADADDDLTAETAALGTPAYMAPEQAAGRAREAGPAADVYSLGVVLYECLAGRVPLRGSGLAETLRLVREAEPVPVRRLAPSVPRDLETVCHKCLHKDPARRYASAAALADDLRRFLDGRPVTARPVGPLERGAKLARRYPLASTLAATAIVALVAGSAVSTAFGLRWRERAIAAEVAQKAADDNAIRANAEAERARDRELRARTAAYALRVDRAFRAWQRSDLVEMRQALAACEPDLRHWEHAHLEDLHRRAARPVAAPPVPAGLVALSPDGRRVLTGPAGDQINEFGEAAVLGPGGGPPRVLDGQVLRTLEVRLGGDRRAYGYHWWPDREKGELIVWDVATGRRLFAGPAPTAGRMAGSAGRVALAGIGELFIWDDRGPRAIAVADLQPSCLAISADGAVIVSGQDEADTARVWDAASGKVVAVLKTGVLASCSLSADGRWLLAVGKPDGPEGPTPVALWDLKERKQTAALKDRPAGVSASALDPAGSRAALETVDGGIVWDVRTGRLVPLEGDDELRLGRFSWGPGPDEVLWCNPAGTTLRWDARTGKALPPLALVEGFGATAVSLGDDGRSAIGLRPRADSGHVSIWDTETGRLVTTLRGPPGVAHAAFVKADGGVVLTESGDGRIRLWDVSTGRETSTEDALRGAASADGRAVAFVTTAGNLLVRDPRTGKALAESRPESADRNLINDLAISGDGRTAVVVRSAGQPALAVEVVNARTGRLTRSIPGPFTTGWLALSADGSRLAFSDLVPGISESVVRVCESATGRELYVTRVAGPVPGTLSTDGRRLAVAEGTTVRLVDLEARREVAILRGVGRVLAVTLSADGTKVITSTSDGSVRLWEPGLPEAALTLGLRDGPGLENLDVSALALSADGSRLVLAGGRYSGEPHGTARILDARTGQPLQTLRGLPEKANAVAADISGDGGRVVVGAPDGTARLFDGAGNLLGTLAGFRSHPGLLTIRRDGRLFTMSQEVLGRPVIDRAVDGETGRELAVPGATPGADRLFLRPPDDRLFMVAADGSVRALTYPGWSESLTLPGTDGPLHDLLVTADGRHLVTQAAGGGWRVRDAATGEELAAGKTPGRGVVAACAAGGTVLLALTEYPATPFAGPGDVLLWDASAGKERALLRGHTRPVIRVAFTPDGRRIFTAAAGLPDLESAGEVKVWDAATGQEVFAVGGIPRAVTELFPSADGRRLLTACFDGLVRVYDAPP